MGYCGHLLWPNIGTPCPITRHLLLSRLFIIKRGNTWAFKRATLQLSRGPQPPPLTDESTRSDTESTELFRVKKGSDLALSTLQGTFPDREESTENFLEGRYRRRLWNDLDPAAIARRRIKVVRRRWRWKLVLDGDKRRRLPWKSSDIYGTWPMASNKTCSIRVVGPVRD